MDLIIGFNRRTAFYLILPVLAISLLLACGPAAQPDSEPFTPALPVAQETNSEPFSASLQPAQDTESTPTSTPTPMPTACVTIEDDKGETSERCFIQPTPLPERFERFDQVIVDAIIDSEEKAHSPGGASSDEQSVLVEIRFKGAANGVAIAKWLTDRNVPNVLYPDSSLVEADVPASTIITVSQLEGVETINTILYFPPTDGQFE